jgi:predicted amidophosphoribosyltransferase
VRAPASRVEEGAREPAWLHAWLDFLLPQGCLGCGGWIRSTTGEVRHLCGTCVAAVSLPPHPRCPRCDAPRQEGQEREDHEVPSHRESCAACVEWPRELLRCRAATLHRPPADALVHALKYGGWDSVAAEMGPVLGRVLQELKGAGSPAPVGLVPIPTTLEKLKVRGYNQAERIASAVSQCTGVPVLPLLARSSGGESQIQHGRSGRMDNVVNAFSINAEGAQRAGVPRHGLVLVDDVLTTGATACAAAQVLAGAGAEGVSLLVWARTPLGKGQRARQRVPSDAEFGFIDQRPDPVQR